MSFSVTYPTKGRGSWPASGRGGTLDVSGSGMGAFFRSPARGSSLPMPGLTALRARREGRSCSINDYAVWRAVMGVQARLSSEVAADGLWGPDTDRATRLWQARHGLVDDGVFGPKSARKMFEPMAVSACRVVSARSELVLMVRGHVAFESGWDPAAVGVVNPRDVGLGQINGPAHPEMTLDERLDPSVALSWIARFTYSNLRAMGYNVRDGVAAYNLGQGGARSWIADGRPEFWGSTNVKQYVDSVLALGRAA